MIRQFRAGARSLIEEIPAGLLDVEGEDAPSCAARELFEETGFRHTSLEPLVALHLSPGILERAGASVRGSDGGRIPNARRKRASRSIRRSFDGAVADARAGRIDDAKTVLALLLADARMAAG